MKKLGTFREWLRESEEHEYYSEEQLLKDITDYNRFQKSRRSHEISLFETHNSDTIDTISYLNENVIEPDKIHIKSTDIVKLNKEFNKFKIFFDSGDELRAVYKQEQDEIHIFISSGDTTIEIEALLAHEMVHKEQNIRSAGNHFKTTAKMVESLNELLSQKQKLISERGGNLIHREQIKQLDSKIQEKYSEFTHLNPFEQMAYACQAIIEYSNRFHKLNDIIDYILKQGFPVTNRFKKYLYQYWIIKNTLKLK